MMGLLQMLQPFEADMVFWTTGNMPDMSDTGT